MSEKLVYQEVQADRDSLVFLEKKWSTKTLNRLVSSKFFQHVRVKLLIKDVQWVLLDRLEIVVIAEEEEKTVMTVRTA